MVHSSISSSHFAQKFNATFQELWNTKLVGGFSEPIYLPSTPLTTAEIRFTGDSVRSALHELAHWCLAGKARRDLLDYGYWYKPDGRNSGEQLEFFKVEVKPQSIEMAFAKKCGLVFEVSCDNLTAASGMAGAVHGSSDTAKAAFENAVLLQSQLYEQHGFPVRAQVILEWCLTTFGRGAA